VSEVAWPLTLYVDDACPLCHAEMAGLAARDRGGCLRMVDCSPAGFHDADTLAAGYTQEALLRRIHARDAQGRWLVGIPVFAAAYEAAGIRWFARLLRLRALRPLWEPGYALFVRNRRWLARIGTARLLAALLPVR
jgi:predicted DCC family thiol-disulfide oxidoreductase YuxK